MLDTAWLREKLVLSDDMTVVLPFVFASAFQAVLLSFFPFPSPHLRMLDSRPLPWPACHFILCDTMGKIMAPVHLLQMSGLSTDVRSM